MRGTAHHRTSLAHGLALATALSACGEFSGRAKPRFTVLTDIGKIVLVHGSIIDHRAATHEVLIRSGYRLDDRLRWNPSWVTPPGTVVDADGWMQTWYLDAREEAAPGARLALSR
jgi:lysine 2,3-aminomutase